MARKIKIKIKINYIYIPIPAIPLSLLAKLLKFTWKHSIPHLKKTGDIQELSLEEINHFIEIVKNIEPFELVNVNTEEENKKVMVQIYTK